MIHMFECNKVIELEDLAIKDVLIKFALEQGTHSVDLKYLKLKCSMRFL